MDARIGGDHARQALSENLGPRLGLAWCLSSAYIVPFWLLPFRSPFPLAAIAATRKCQRRRECQRQRKYRSNGRRESKDPSEENCNGEGKSAYSGTYEGEYFQGGNCNEELDQ